MIGPAPDPREAASPPSPIKVPVAPRFSPVYDGRTLNMGVGTGADLCADGPMVRGASRQITSPMPLGGADSTTAGASLRPDCRCPRVGFFLRPNPSMQRNKETVISAVLILVSLALSAGAAEVILRLKNSSMTNYDIEMWRYAKELKQRSDDPEIDFDHVRSKSAVLQSIAIRINEWGLRGGPVTPTPPGGRRILFLGGSITLGWGVPEEATVEARLERMLRASGEEAQVLNGGIGNYNAERYVARFFKELTALHPTDIVVHYFLRDAEDLEAGNTNFLLRHSELAVTLWIAYHRLYDRSGEGALVEHYRNAYEPGSRGFAKMSRSLGRLADYAKERGIRIYLAMVPDVHNLINYDFRFVHEAMRRVSDQEGYTYVDLLPALQGRPAKELAAMPGDPHPNALGHELMADAIFPILTRHDKSAIGQ